MPTPKQYREFAEECFRWARHAATEEQRKAFLDMARTWKQAAAKGDVLNDAGDQSPPGSNATY